MAKRYIDANELIGQMHFIQFADGSDRSLVYALIDMQPTADVVEVVRCKDCKHRDEGGFCLGRGYPEQLVPDDGYCDKGDRKEVKDG